jgi:hypothetical protein
VAVRVFVAGNEVGGTVAVAEISIVSRSLASERALVAVVVLSGGLSSPADAAANVAVAMDRVGGKKATSVACLSGGSAVTAKVGSGLSAPNVLQASDKPISKKSSKMSRVRAFFMP